MGSGAGPLMSDSLVGIVKLAAYVLVISPWLVLAERRYQGPSRLAGMVMTAVRKVRARR